MSLFQKVDFKSHSGLNLSWKIECDEISKKEWKCLAEMIMDYEKRPFQAALGIPRGGIILGTYLNEYSTQNIEDPYLIVDDVLTTGGAMEEFKKEYANTTGELRGYLGYGFYFEFESNSNFDSFICLNEKCDA